MEGLEPALSEKARPGKALKITGGIEARLVLLACSNPPEGQARWTFKLLADKLVDLELVDSISEVAVYKRLKNALRPWKVKSWCIAKPSARFVAKMENVLEVYARPFDPKRPVVCLDEKSKDLHAQMWEALPVEPGKPRREDSEYARNGVAHLFLWVEPLAGRRGVRVTQRRTAVDFAHELRLLSDEAYPQAERIVLVTDNLNTHTTAYLYEAFAQKKPAESPSAWSGTGRRSMAPGSTWRSWNSRCWPASV